MARPKRDRVRCVERIKVSGMRGVIAKAIAHLYAVRKTSANSMPILDLVGGETLQQVLTACPRVTEINVVKKKALRVIGVTPTQIC